jgi:FkbM family methyltransferase
MPDLWKTTSLLAVRALALSLRKLQRDEVEGIAYHFRESGGSAAIDVMELFAKEFVRPSRGDIYNAKTNGEQRLVEATGDLDFRTIFDVGANVGGWTKLAHDHHSHAQIHSFEIVPSTFATLTMELQGLDRIVLNPLGMLDEPGQVDVYVGGGSAIASTLQFSRGDARSVVSCSVTSGDKYMDEHAIDAIDFLKVDVEGVEGAVLRGFHGAFARRAVRLVQFEYNRGAIESRFLLRDFYNFFVAHGYAVGKLTGQGVLFREYEYAHEDFSGPNYVACRSDDTPLIRRIAMP